MSLTSENRKSIIKTLQEWQRTGAFDNFEESNMNFDKCEDDELIYYRDEWLMSEYNIKDKYSFERMKEWYNEDEIKEFLIEKLNMEKKYPMEFMFRLRRVLEYANSELDDSSGEIKELTEKYANTIYHELLEVVSDDDISFIEEHELLSEL